MTKKEAERVVVAIEDYVGARIAEVTAGEDVDGQAGIATYHCKQALIEALTKVRAVVLRK